MRTVIKLHNKHGAELPEKWRNDDVRYTEELVRIFVNDWSQPGDVVIDPFAGFGTTVRIAEEMGREAYGVEYDAERCEYVRKLLKNPGRIVNGDSRDFAGLRLPVCALSMTSPPYMGRKHQENPFTAYSTIGGGYLQYLNTMRSIYAQIKLGTKKGGHALIEVSNHRDADGTITNLAWDIAEAVSEVFPFKGEYVIEWEPTYAYGYDHSYVLVFKNE